MDPRGAYELEADARIAVSLAFYSRGAILRACYAFTDRADLWVEPAEDDALLVAITRQRPEDELRTLLGDFFNALVDFQLRDLISRETADTRTALVRAALG